MNTIYLTYIDRYSAVYKTQVIGQCKLYTAIGYKVKLIALLPLSAYRKDSKKIKEEYPNSTILPIVTRFYSHPLAIKTIAILIKTLFNPDRIITRSLYAQPILSKIVQLNPNCKIVYDARGAAAIELKEYGGKDSLNSSLLEIFEKKILELSSKVFTVSDKLAQYFIKTYQTSTKTYTIPCCVPKISVLQEDEVNHLLNKRKKKYDQYETIFVYAGSLSVWNLPQSLLKAVKIILSNPKNALIILSNELEKLNELDINKSNNLFLNSVEQYKVKYYLGLADYGLLLRDNNITNMVASPSKFGEYLAAGLKVIISENIGDLSEFVINNNCGHILGQVEIDNLKPLSEAQRHSNISLANEYFLRESHINTNKYIEALEND